MPETEVLQKLIRQTVGETLRNMGFDTQAPGALQADMYYLRRMRLGSEDIARHVQRALLTVVVSTGLFLLWQAVRGLLGK